MWHCLIYLSVLGSFLRASEQNTQVMCVVGLLVKLCARHSGFSWGHHAALQMISLKSSAIILALGLVHGFNAKESVVFFGVREYASKPFVQKV